MMLTIFLGLGVYKSPAQTAETKVEEEKLVRQGLSPEERAERETNRMTRELTLTTEQQSQFKAFALERINGIKSLQDKIKASTDQAEKESLQNEIKVVGEKFDTNVKSILTAEQLPKWEAKKEQRLNRSKPYQAKPRKVPANN